MPIWWSPRMARSPMPTPPSIASSPSSAARRSTPSSGASPRTRARRSSSCGCDRMPRAAAAPPAGRPGYGLWSFEDVTARHEMEQVIRDEQMKLADFLDNAPTGFYSVDGEGRFLFVNQALAEWLGASAGELVESGARLKEFLVGDVPAGSPPHAPFEGAASGASRGEIVLRGRQGRTVYASISQSVVPTRDRLRTRSVVRALTPEREWEEALRLSRQRFQRFFANAPVGIALLDRSGRLEEANRALGELLDSSPQELIGERLIDFLHEDDRGAIAAKLAEAAAGTTLLA